MPKKTDIRMLMIVTLGVMLAGYGMYLFRDVQIVEDAGKGFGA